MLDHWFGQIFFFTSMPLRKRCVTEIFQYFPNHNNQKRKMFHLQLDSKETFHCYHSSSGGRAKKLERLVKRHGC